MPNRKGERAGYVILPSKMTRPLPPANVVARPALDAKLACSLNSSVTTMVAPAGYGKTTAVLSWTRSLSEEVPVAWYAMGAEDATSARFWLYVTAALRAVDNRLCPDFDEAAFVDSASTTAALEALVLRMSEFAHDFLLVLEDYHTVQSDVRIGEEMRFLVRRLPANAHLIFTSRQAVKLPLARLRVEGLLVEVGQQDLCFSAREVAELFDAMGVRLTNDDASTVCEATNGWVTGGKLVALLSGDGSRTRVKEAVGKAQSSIDEYLFEEVLADLPVSQRRFMLGTATVDAFCPSLAERITGLSSAEVANLIAALVSEDLFIEPLERNDGETWYRYHRLLSDLLRATLEREDRSWAEQCRRGARDWLEENGYHDTAVSLSADLKDWEGVRRIVLANWRSLYMADNHAAVVRWSRALPEEEVLASPLLCAVLSMPCALQGDFGRAETYLHQATLGCEGERGLLFALCQAQWAFLASFRGDAEAMDTYARTALACLPEEDYYLRGMMLQVQASSCEDLDPLSAKISFARAADLQRGYGNRGLTCSVYGNLAFICANLGHIAEARHYAGAACALYNEEERQFKPMLTYAHLAYMVCAYEEGDFERVLDEYQEFERMASEGAVPDGVAQASTLRAKVLYRKGLPAGKEAFFAAFDASLPGSCRAFPSISMVRDWCTAFRTRAVERASGLSAPHHEGLFDATAAFCLDMAGRFEEVCSYIEAINPDECAARVRGLVLAAAFADKVARYGRAEAYLEEATQLARDAGLQGALSENALYLAPVATRLVSSTDDATLASYLRTWVMVGDVRDSAASKLTDREIDVVRCIAEGATVAEVAERLYVSRDTVKKHLSNIYAKLDVHSKMQAVALLRDEGML